MSRKSIGLFLAAFVGLAALAGAAKDRVAAVLSDDTGPYQTALNGFQNLFQQSFSVTPLRTLSVKSSPEIVVAFGGKAAVQKYPESTTLIYCMAPGTRISPAERDGISVEIALVPKPNDTLKRLKTLQPSLKRLGVLWVSPAYDAYAKDLQAAGQGMAVQVIAERINRPEELPETLRKLQGRVDGLWIPPDPLLIRPETLTVLTQFSWSNKVPYYSPVAGLINQGAMATHSIEYEEIGRTAARTAIEVLNGAIPPSIIYPETSRLTINLKTAQQCGITIPQDVLDKADKVIP